jgi:hypothetical protein
LPVGDYAIRHDDQPIASVEPNTREDFTKSLIDGLLDHALAELASLPAAAVVIKQRYGTQVDNEHALAGWLLELVAGSGSATPKCRSCSPIPESSPRNTSTVTSLSHSCTTPPIGHKRSIPGRDPPSTPGPRQEPDPLEREGRSVDDTVSCPHRGFYLG